MFFLGSHSVLPSLKRWGVLFYDIKEVNLFDITWTYANTRSLVSTMAPFFYITNWTFS